MSREDRAGRPFPEASAITNGSPTPASSARNPSWFPSPRPASGTAAVSASREYGERPSRLRPPTPSQRRAWVSASRQQRCRLAGRYPRRGPARLTAAGQSRPAIGWGGGPTCRRRGTMSWSWLTMPSAAVMSVACSKMPPRTICTSADQGPEPARWRFGQRWAGRTGRRTRQHGDHRLHPAIIGCTLIAATTVTAASSAKPPAPGCPRTDCDDAPGAPRGRGRGPEVLSASLAGITVIFAVAARMTLALASPVPSSPWGESHDRNPARTVRPARQHRD
jgi:hypothetical protein